MELNTPLYTLTGIGSSLTIKLKKLNLNTVSDLIYHFPFRYDDFSKVSQVSLAQIGETVTLQGEIWSIKNIYTRFGKVLTQAIFNDGTIPIVLTWFNQSWLLKQIEVGDKLQVSGKLTKYKSKLGIMASQWERLPTPGVSQVDTSGLHTGRLVPVYPETAGLTSKWVRTKIDQILPQVLDKIVDPLPTSIRNGMMPLSQAIQKIHLPDSIDEVEKARERLGFDELFLIQLATQQARLLWNKKIVIKPWTLDDKKIQDFIDKLPFKLTNAQERVLDEITADCKKDIPMNRLLQGEVGSGKTVVATVTMYLAHLNGFQSLFMAPTEILAWQHYETVRKLLEPYGIYVGIYTGSRKKVADSIIIGTHALLSEALKPGKVGLVVIDEQHRFGVEQRTYLRQKGAAPHFLTMTATPIPRTVALTLYGDLDLSIIDELPKGRPQIKTYLVPEEKRADSYKFIAKKVAAGDQVYIITPLIEQSETLVTTRAAKVEYERLKDIFPNFKLGLLHGRMKAKEKEAVLADFRSGSLQILVATSVVEVGMDIPNATIMVVEGAERFGLAQLHQLRGRIGRGTKQSYCLLYTSDVVSWERRRLKYLENTFDGLKLAELDLKIRGSGTIFSTLQHGRFDLKIAKLTDLKLIEQTRDAARKILSLDPNLDKHPNLKAKLESLTADVMPD